MNNLENPDDFLQFSNFLKPHNQVSIKKNKYFLKLRNLYLKIPLKFNRFQYLLNTYLNLHKIHFDH